MEHTGMKQLNVVRAGALCTLLISMLISPVASAKNVILFLGQQERT